MSLDLSTDLIGVQSEYFDWEDPPIDPIKLSVDIVDTMVLHGGLAIASNEVGVKYSCIATRSKPYLVMFNPVLTSTSGEMVKMEEGNLSYKGLLFPVTRPRNCRVRYNDPSGNICTKNLTDIESRLVQQYVDVVNGHGFEDKVDWFNKRKLIKKMKAYNKEKRSAR